MHNTTAGHNQTAYAETHTSSRTFRLAGFFPISFWHSSTPALRLRLLVNTHATRWSTIALCVTRWLRRSDVLRSSRVEWVLAAGLLARWANARTAKVSRLLAQRRRLVDAFFETLGELHGGLMIVP